MARYLVTGGAGFIGSHIAETLVGQGDEVRVLDDLSTGKMENLAPIAGKFEFVKGDIRDLAACRRAVEGVGTVFHEAALASVARSVEDPLLCNAVNVTGTLNLLVAARDAGVRSFVLASSSAVYGDDPGLPKVEGREGRPVSPYSRPRPRSRAKMTLRLGWTFSRTPRISASNSSTAFPWKTLRPRPFMPGLTWASGIVTVAASAATAVRTSRATAASGRRARRVPARPARRWTLGIGATPH